MGDLLSCFVSVLRYKVAFRFKVAVEVSVMKGREVAWGSCCTCYRRLCSLGRQEILG